MIMKTRPNILVCGQCGCGKTRLIKAVCQQGTVPDEAIKIQTRKGFDSVVYETEFVDFIDAPHIELGDSAKEYWKNLQRKTEKHSPCDCIWYCIDGSNTAVQRGDLEILKLAGDKVIAVITNAESIDNEMQEGMIDKLEKNIPAERIVTVSYEHKIGLNKLLDCSKNIIYGELRNEEDEKTKLFEDWDNYFSHQKEEWSKSTTKCAEEYVYWGAGRAFTIAAVPIPMADVIPLVANEAYMIYRIGVCYGYAVDKTTLASFAGCLGGSIVGKIAASIIPFLKAPIAATVTYGIGRAAMAYFESDMNISKEELKEIFKLSKLKGQKINWQAPA